MTDPYSKEVPGIEVDASIGGARVCRILDRLFLTRPLPETLILDKWATIRGDGAGWVGGSTSRATAPSFSMGNRCSGGRGHDMRHMLSSLPG
jgi:putative transposase